ncbi:MAG: cation transporter [Pyrinomonadaceae bacterium]|nr:cation transporter [Pyrinomonadaceae bacterium]
MLKEKTVLGGAIVAAFTASLCCIAPLLFVLLGMGSLGMAAIFEPFRPYLMGGAVILLALAYYWIYFKNDASASCAPGEECATKPANRASRFGLWFATFAVILFALTPYITASIANRIGTTEPVVAKSDDDCCLANNSPKTDNAVSTDNQPPANSKRVTFTVTGMTCVTCEPAIRLALEKTPGVMRADVSYERGNAIVDYDPKQTTPEKLRDVINGTGYKVKE